MSSDRRQPRGLRALVVVLIALAIGCADFSRGRTIADAGDGGETADAVATSDGQAALSFATDIYSVLSICMNCHVPGGAASTTSLIFSGNAASDYATVLGFVDISAPASSRLLAKMSGNGHGGGTVYAAGSAEYETVLQWIQQGAQP